MAECSGEEAMPLSQEGNQVSISAGATDPHKGAGRTQYCCVHWVAYAMRRGLWVLPGEAVAVLLMVAGWSEKLLPGELLLWHCGEVTYQLVL